MELTKKQHYVPQCYLKQFSAKKNEKLDYHDKITGKSFSAIHVENVAQQRYYYDFSEEFVESYNKRYSSELNSEEINKQFLEKHFSKLETGFGTAFSNLAINISNEKDILQAKLENLIAADDKKELANFMALQSIQKLHHIENYSII